jgi:glutamate 5-kinase
MQLFFVVKFTVQQPHEITHTEEVCRFGNIHVDVEVGRQIDIKEDDFVCKMSKTAKCYTIVVKLGMLILSRELSLTEGTSSLCDETTREHKIANMSQIVEMAVKLRRDGHRVLIVSSGAIAVGLQRLKMAQRPKHLAAVQGIAAIGQARLIGLWDDLFRQLNQPIAQILLTRNDIADVSRDLKN